MNDALFDAKNLVTVDEASFKLLDTSLGKHNAAVSRLNTEFEASDARVVELNRDVKTATATLPTASNNAQEASSSVFH